MKKGNIYSGDVRYIRFPNKGIVIYDEEDAEKTAQQYRISVKGTIPGQMVKFRISKKKKGKCEGKLIEVLEKSPLENRRPPCAHYGKCGGCCYQSLEYKDQLELKEQIVKEILDSVSENYEYQGIERSPEEFGYRNKMEYSFGDEYKDGPLSLGLHKMDSFYDIITTNECLIVHRDYNEILNNVLDFFKEIGVKYYHKISHKGYLRHLLVRRAGTTGEIIVGIVTTTESDIDLNPLADRLLNLKLEGKIVGISHIYNDSVSDVVKCDKMEQIYGRNFIYENILNLEFKVSVFSFFQTNSKGAEVLYEKAREFAGDIRDRTVFDLYSGTGTIAQILAPVAKKVVGVEIVEEAVSAAIDNAKLNKLDNCSFIAGDVLKVLDEITEKPDMIILDPPRDGIHPKALLKIIGYGVEKIVYISCKPTSLARDLAVFEEHGYRAEKACAVDMFPQTANIETVCLISRES